MGMDDRSVLDLLRAELAELRAENRELRSRVERLEPQVDPPTSRSTRRGALAMAAGVAGGAIAASLGDASPADAANPPLLLGLETNSASNPTGLEVSGTVLPYGVAVTDNGLGVVPTDVHPALLVHADGKAFYTGVFAYVTDNDVGVTAVTAQNDGSSAEGHLATGDGYGVVGWAGPAGVGVLGRGPNNDGVVGAAYGPIGVGVHGLNYDGTGPAIWADAQTGAGNALLATSTGGRGVVASGKQAHLQLTPSNQKTHPKAGEAGDLFCDKSARLWFCKVGGAAATWKQIA